MSFPRGLKFRDRRADDAESFYFDCARSGHATGQKRIKRAFGSRRDREVYVTRHDAKYHDELLAGKLGIQFGPALGDTVADFMRHLQRLYQDGKRDIKTFHYYRGICRKLVTHFGYHTQLDKIGRAAGLAYAQSRRDGGSKSQGARFIKELKVLKRLQRFAGLTVVWETPVDDIAPTRRERKPIDIEDIRAFLRAMTPGSLEHVFATTKLVTMMRNEELYAANVGDLSFRAADKIVTAELSYRLRNKRSGASQAHVSYIPHELALLLQAWTEGRDAAEPLFSIEGRRLTAWSLRKRFLRASERATAQTGHIRPVHITSIGQFRAEGSTIAQEELGATYPVTEQLGHRSETTTRRHYKLSRRASTLRESKRVTESVESKLIH